MSSQDHPRVASNVCLALHNLATHCEDKRDQPSNELSAPFVDLARALLAATERADVAACSLRASAYEALNSVLENSAEDTNASVLQLLPVILQRLEATFAMQCLTAEDREAQTELQGLLCAVLQVWHRPRAAVIDTPRASSPPPSSTTLTPRIPSHAPAHPLTLPPPLTCLHPSPSLHPSVPPSLRR